MYGALKQKINLNRPTIINLRRFKNFDSERINFDTAPWHIIQLFDEVDDQIHVWNLIMNDVLNDLASVKKMRVRDKDVPYMTSEWKCAIRSKRKFNAKYLIIKTPATWKLRHNTRNDATKQRRIAIKNYWKTKAADLKSNPRDFSTF